MSDETNHPEGSDVEEIHDGDALPAAQDSGHFANLDLDLDWDMPDNNAFNAEPKQDLLYDGVTGERLNSPATIPPNNFPEVPRDEVTPIGEESIDRVQDQTSSAESDLSSDPWPSEPTPFEPPFVPVPYTPEPYEDSVRQSGLAWSAGIAFFGSVAFTLFLGWIVDVLLGTSPWGIVAGIVMGSVIGFVQFFRITSRIFPSRDKGPAVSPLRDAGKDSDD